jgi:hypothetical protein
VKRIAKPPGHVWHVTYLDADDPTPQVMTVFGKMRPEDAIAEARWSLEAGGGDTDYEITVVRRADTPEIG